MLSETTRAQIEALPLNGDRPLVICDVDEVVVHFLRALEAYLETCDCWLDPASFALNGNVKRVLNHEPVPTAELGTMLEAFFTEHTATFEAIEGAAAGLETLASVADIVMLTNLPEAYLADRRRNLEGHGMCYPVVVNSGLKGAAVQALTERCAAPAIFLDDSPSNIVSVRDTVPETHIVHFMQDARFARHTSDLDGIFLKSDNWRETTDHLGALLSNPG